MFVMEVPLPVLMLWAIGLSALGATDGDEVGTAAGGTYRGEFIMDCWK
jgi:hypothetical protein